MSARRGRPNHRALAAAAARASLSQVSPHSLRHTHGSMLLAQGWPITEVAHRLGDDVHTVARTYAHKLRDSDRDLSFLDEFSPDAAGAVGNGWAPQDRGTTANHVPAERG